LTACAFASYRQLDASFDEDLDAQGETVVSSLREDGYHRTRSEIRSSGNLSERLIGASLRYRSGGGSIGVTAYHARYSSPLQADASGGAFDDAVALASVDGLYSAAWGTAYGEIARGTNGAVAAVGGIVSRIGPGEITLSGRWLPARFFTPHGSAAAAAANERGVYAGLRTPLAAGLLLSAYFDIYHAPERSRSVPFPRMGSDGYLRLTYAPTRSITLELGLRRASGRERLHLDDTLDRDRIRILERTMTTGRLDAAYRAVGDRVELRGRLERCFVEIEQGAPARSGIMGFVDIRLRPLASLAIGTRLALFDVDDGDATIYELEQDLPGRMASIALAGEGRRFYLYLRWRPSAGLAVAAKYAETVYSDRTVISPGSPQQIEGPVGNTFALQLDLRF
jgi:hypothetical protein